MALLEVRGLSKRFGGVRALDRVDLAVEEGMIFSLIGPNGAGKTTLFHILTALHRPDEGEVLFGGRSLARFRPDQIAAAGIGRTFQNIRLFPHMTVMENILVGMHLHLNRKVTDILFRTKQFLTDEKDAELMAAYFLGLVGLQGKGREWARHLSYGDQRRLEVARALAVRPKLLLLDEPTAGMNPVEARSFMALLRQLMEEVVQSILLIEHNMRVVMEISDRVSVLDYGVKIAEGSPDEVRGNPGVIEAYLGRRQWGTHA